MKINYIKNKFLLGFASCAMFLGLSNSSVLAQTRKPTAAEIQQARTNLRQIIQSLQNNEVYSSIKNNQTPDSIQERNRFVNAWQKVNPEITPFLGSWVNYEEAWGIHPSNKPGSVCLIKTQPEGLSIEIGTVANNSIYTNKGKVFIKEGDYLGFGTIKNDRLDFTSMVGILLNSPIKLQNPYAFESIDGKPASPKVLKSYAQAGCTASEPSNNIAEQTTIENLPDGKYVYGEIPYPEILNISYLIFEKSENIITGVDYYTRSSGFSCFKGTARGNNIIDTTFVTPAMGRGNSIVDKNRSLDLSQHYHIENTGKHNHAGWMKYCDDIAKGTDISFSSNNNVASHSNTMTCQEFKSFAQQKKLSGLDAIIPSQFPNQFADGQVAMTMLSTGGLGYVVAKEGVNIPNLSSVKELRQTDGSFSAVDLNNAIEFPLPALEDVPESLYDSSQLIEITNWASRYDDEGLRDLARQSEQTTLPNGQKAYYLKQGSKQGWCIFKDESAQYSDYLCVNIANSPKTSLEILKSILPGKNTASNPNSTHRSSNTNASKPQIKIPDSFKLIMENGMNTEFVKGDDGYYTWLWNDRPGNCFGLKDNKDPAKVQLATYRCNSKKKARTWEILIANDNTNSSCGL